MIRTLEPGNQWDQTLIGDLLAKVNHDRIVVTIVPGRYWFDKTDKVNELIRKDFASLLIVTGDEEALFPTEKIEHPNIKIWVQSPHSDNPRYADRYFPIGYSPLTRSKVSRPDKAIKWFFAGQITHARRKRCVEQLRQMPGGVLVETKGFNQGIDPETYLDNMRASFVVPCPSGAVIPDTFRLYEALEAGAVPLADALDPKKGSRGYFNFLFDDPELPFQTIEDWVALPGTANYFFDTYPLNQNRCFAWWQQQKYQMVRNLKTDIMALSQEENQEEPITVLVPTSPIKSNPDTAIIEETLASIRHHLPDATILVMIDGVREEQEEYREQYEQFIHRLLWICNEQDNLIPILFKEHNHQAKMTRETLKLVDTPAILFVEHDTPLVTDYEIPFDGLTEKIISKEADVIRFHHEARIIPDHEHLMVDMIPADPDLPLLRTAQWSQRPHLASTDYYRDLITNNIHQDSKTMIEDAVHGLTQEKWLRQGFPGWNQHKIWMYAPQDGNMKRSYHLDGRGDDPKYEMGQF